VTLERPLAFTSSREDVDDGKIHEWLCEHCESEPVRRRGKMRLMLSAQLSHKRSESSKTEKEKRQIEKGRK